PALLPNILRAAAKAPGNRPRFLKAGLLDAQGKLSQSWQKAFATLQPLTKAELRQQPGQFLAQAEDVVFRGKTSGTQSTAFTYFAGEQWNNQRIKARQRSLSWWEIDTAIPMLNLGSRLPPVRSHDMSLIGPIDASFLKALRPILLAGHQVVIRGYPSRLCEVAALLYHAQITLSSTRVVAVIATGECLFEFQRSRLSQTFQAPVINEYGCQESGISGLSCPEVGRLHLDGDRCLYEIVDGQLLTTDLYNHTLPMVRYSSGDRLTLCSEPCPCGRPGPTAQILGRQEESILIKGEQRWPGDIDLPPFHGLLGYQLQISPNRHRVWMQPTDHHQKIPTQPFQNWLEQTFGTVDTEIVIEAPQNVLIAETKADSPVEAVNSQAWMQQVTGQPWSSWLNAPLPSGEAGEIASLLQQLVAPRHLVLKGLSPQTLPLIEALSQSPAACNSDLEGMKIRVLLWATSQIAGDLQNEREGERLYQAVLERFQRWSEGRDTTKSYSALGFDLLAPLLTLETQIAQQFSLPVQELIQHHWPQSPKADPFTMHHYLAVLDWAGQKASRQRHPWIPALRPLAAVLLGDFHRFAAQLDLSLIMGWAEMIHGCPGLFAGEADKQVPSSTATFKETWQTLRRSLLQRDLAKVEDRLAGLSQRAQSPEQIAHCCLEKGYIALVFDKPFNPVELIEILQQQAVLGSSKTPSGSVNPLPWIPILRALAPQLVEAGKPSLAYACLLAAAPPNRQGSNFDRQSQGVNAKQSVVSSWNMRS
ncbi:MAG: hypothetical protein WA902_19205, partial [Thermosynechococcaceae cyanobacterium]